jgi:Protein of unknown function (DUF1648)
LYRAVESKGEEDRKEERMMRAAYKPMLVLMWLALVTSALIYWRSWDQLPARMAVHFDANWQPNGYTSKEGAVELNIMTVMLVLFTVAGLIAHAMKPVAAWPMLFIFYVVIGFCWYGNNWIVNFNLRSQQVHSEAFGNIESSSQFLVAKMLARHPDRPVDN